MSSSGGSLVRSVGLGGAVAIGLASVLGAGVFSVLGPATATAGGWIFAAVALAAVVATANGLSTARLAARMPVSGGAYTYGRERLGPWPGFAAGWMFLVGKTASCCAIALTVGRYLWPGAERPVGLAVLAVAAALNVTGIRRTARAAVISCAIVVTILVGVLIAGMVGGVPAPAAPAMPVSPSGVFTAAALLFFAFAGYARVATLGEEVRDPQRVIPRAIVLTLASALTLYLVITAVLLQRVGLSALARSTAPLHDLAGPGWAPVVTVGAVVAGGGSLSALLAGLSRTALAMAREGDLPRAVSIVHPRWSTPARADVLLTVVIGVLILVVPFTQAVALSSFAVLVYYLIANLSALAVEPGTPRRPVIPVVGAVGCAALAFALSSLTVLAGAVLLSLGLVGRRLRHRWSESDRG